ncbi:MAG: N-6 DNA methylase [Thermodesulfovibrionales bacterium]|jgi:tRNA1(Val) A37 N6-methylase TrmN6
MKESIINTALNKKRYGVYYTPTKISCILCNWAIRSHKDNILEPSFGGCGFLEASKERLIALSNRRPNYSLFGCDVDINAFNHLSEKIGPSDLTARFLLIDFLQTEPTDFLVNKFEVIIGNPPYVSHHNMPRDQKESAVRLIRSEGVSLHGRASLWAYFILHSLRFLKEGGRMAWILPISFLYADYASSVKNVLEAEFSRLLVISSRKRIFLSEGSDEDTIILLAEGLRKGPAEKGLEIYFADDVLCELDKLVEAWSTKKLDTSSLQDRIGYSLLSRNILNAYKTLLINEQTRRLGDIVEILIGMVTGDNRFFVINKNISKELKLSDGATKFVLAKFNMVHGIKLEQCDFKKARDNNMRCLLVNTDKMRRNSPLYRYITNYPEEKRKHNRTFEKRDIWCKPDDGRIPDAFFPYMHHTGPRIVLNDAGANCTNNIHRLYFKSGYDSIQRKLVCISMLTSFSQLSAELAGRSYGSGVLKHEPSEARNIAFVMPQSYRARDVEESFERIDNFCRMGFCNKARSLANAFILKEVIKKYGEDIIEGFEEELANLRTRRYSTETDKAQA